MTEGAAGGVVRSPCAAVLISDLIRTRLSRHSALDVHNQHGVRPVLPGERTQFRLDLRCGIRLTRRRGRLAEHVICFHRNLIGGKIEPDRLRFGKRFGGCAVILDVDASGKQGKHAGGKSGPEKFFHMEILYLSVTNTRSTRVPNEQITS